MSKNVFADGQEIACEKGDGKVVAAFPDVCLSPPAPPAGPLPVPYPNSSFSKDMKEGSTSVKIGGGKVMLKDRSYYQTSPLGNEAATRNFGAGVVSHSITGKTYFGAWSMDVKFEGENVDRHLDLTTSNHNGTLGNESAPLPNAEASGDGAAGDEEPDKPKCPCCGKDAHSAAQAAGQSMSESEFYSPAGEPQAKWASEAPALLRQIRNGPCKNLLPPARPGPKTKCAQYFITTIIEKKRIEGVWDAYRDRYYLKFKVSKGTTIGHRVPKGAGGCPTGPGNLTPVMPDCVEIEDQLSNCRKEP